ncbi:MAG: glycosyltransferase [Hydrogenothermaceae bacterium]|nr:glycosyltransferase [Hydrogenothermaceae bacterium]
MTVNYKSYKDVLELAKSIDENDYKNVDFIVVDNSEDEIEYENLSVGLEDIFKNSNKNYSVLKNVNSGYAGGNNLGIKFALEELNVDYIWILNPDTVITSGSILELLRTIEFTDIPVATCKMVDYYSGACQYDDKSVDFLGHRKDCNTQGIFRADFLGGTNISLKKDVIERVGLFEEKYFLYFENNESLKG